MLNKLIRFFLFNRLVTLILLLAVVLWGISTAPFSWTSTGWLPRDPVPVDAIPDLGENQQIVFTEWPGRSPQDIEDQVSYPLTTALLGIPGVKTIRSNSIFGLSSVYIIFNDDVDFYWSRSRILEKLNSLPPGTLPEGLTPALGPDATALGQVFWYTLEGRDHDGEPIGGWDPHELRSIQDFYVKYGLASAEGVAEVASIGGFVKEYQVDIDPAAMKAHNVTVGQVMSAVKKSNQDVGARTIEFNRAEYFVRALGYVKSIEDLEASVIVSRNNTPIRIKDVARVVEGPATRRGGLDKNGAEAVGGVVVARYGANPLEVIDNVKLKIEELSAGLPSKDLGNNQVSKVTVVPFYDRTGLIKETIGTLEEALLQEILISIIVIVVLVMRLRASILISSLLPAGVLVTFVAMRNFGVDANIVALSGIAIAIGVMVDVGVVIVENILRHLEGKDDLSGDDLANTIASACSEVSGAVVVALTTTIISFIPVFALEAAEGKLFRPLAFTKTFAMLAALLIGLVVVPTLSYYVFSLKVDRRKVSLVSNGFFAVAGIVVAVWMGSALPLIALCLGINNVLPQLFQGYQGWSRKVNTVIVLLFVGYVLTKAWVPLGVDVSLLGNLLFVGLIVGIILAVLWLILKYYSQILRWSLDNKKTFLSIPFLLVIWGMLAWQGFVKIADPINTMIGGKMEETVVGRNLASMFPGMGKEFMPSLDEGSFLLMPTTMPHSGVEENVEVIRKLDILIGAIPEVDETIGKWGRVNSALDPAPVSMFENVINYLPEYKVDKDGRKLRFKVDDEGAFELVDGATYMPNRDAFRRIKDEALIYDANGSYFRQWRPHIKSPDDIWNEIVEHASFPGLTSAPKLQPIETRLVMLQTGMRAPMGIKVFGPDLASIEKAGLQLERHMKNVEGVKPASVFADRVVGKPYLEIDIDRMAISRYGLSVQDVQEAITVGIGGMPLTQTVEGRERYTVRVRYAREFRDSPEDLKSVLIPAPNGQQLPLSELADIKYARGPQLIRGEDTFLVGYVIFDKQDGFAEVDVVENAQEHLNELLASGNLTLPNNVSYRFTGNYENQVRATNKLRLVIPISLASIFLILYFQFRSTIVSGMVFTGVIVAFSGGFIMLWLYGQPWFLNFEIGSTNFRELLQVQPYNLSVAVWVGFIALFGVATDDGVLMGTYLAQNFKKKSQDSISDIRALVVESGKKRVRPATMTTATTLIALIPVLTSTGKGSDIMVPMAIPSFGGMAIQVLTMFIVPILYCMYQEWKFNQLTKRSKS